MRIAGIAALTALFALLACGGSGSDSYEDTSPDAIAKDVAETGVLVNCVAPAVIDTPILDGITQEHVDYMIERIPLGRMGTADEVAALVCWLASEECTFSTGATFDISGGRAVY